MAGLQGRHRLALGVVGDKTLLGDGVSVGTERGVESHARQYDLQGNIQPRNLALLVQAKGVADTSAAARQSPLSENASSKKPLDRINYRDHIKYMFLNM